MAAATREVYWNVGPVWPMYLMFAAALAVFGHGFYHRHYKLWRLGRAERRGASPRERLRGLALYALAQLRVLRDRYSGVFHLLFSWGIAVLTVGTLVVMVHQDFGIPVMRGRFYLYFQSLTLDIFGLLAMAGVAMAAAKRYLIRPDRLNTNAMDGLALGALFVILAQGFALEGLRIAATGDPWAAWSPIGSAIAAGVKALGWSVETARAWHAALWWSHAALAFAAIAALPWTKAFHLVTGPANIYFRSLEPKGALRPLDLEASETLGAARLTDFSVKDLFDLSACMECGRCQQACPAYNTGKPLSPKMVILDLRGHLREAGPGLLAARRRGGAAGAGGGDGAGGSAGAHAGAGTGGAAGVGGVAGAGPQAGEGPSPLIGQVIAEETLWSCTTCRACMTECPVFIEHVPKIIDLRRYLVMERSDFPPGMQEAMRGLEARGHPFRGATASRSDWYRDLGVPEMAEVGDAREIDVLHWAGCAAAFDERNQRVARAFARVMQRAGVRFAVLGPEENCTGDPARRIGHEYLFQVLARQNIATLQGYGVTRIVTACPHCFNTLKNEYPRFGGEFEVIHHSRFIARLLAEGRLRLSDGAGAGAARRLTYHDPCYLGRYNDTYDEPRAVLDRLPGSERVEMTRSRDRGFCCGGGGGRAWLEETGARINHARAGEAVGTGADTIAAACPFCLMMLEDGVKARQGEREVSVRDLAELVEETTRPREAGKGGGGGADGEGGGGGGH